MWPRVVERRRAVALATHYREAEGLSMAQTADRLGCSPATIKAYFYDPTGEKARGGQGALPGAVPRLRRVHAAANGKGDAYAYCKACHPGAIERRWTRRRVVDAMRVCENRYGQLPSSYDWPRMHATRRGGEAIERFSIGDWPSARVVTDVYGSWTAARDAASKQVVDACAGEPGATDPPSGNRGPTSVIGDQCRVDGGYRPSGVRERGTMRETQYLQARARRDFQNGAEWCEPADRRAVRSGGRATFGSVIRPIGTRLSER